MKTKKLEYYADLMPGWMDIENHPVLMNRQCLSYMGSLPDGYRRVKVTVDFPCFGGSADCTDSVESCTETVKAGYQEEA